MNHDITESVFFRYNPDPMWVFDVQSLQFLDVNNAAMEKYGYSLSEFLAMGIDKIRPEEDLEAFYDFLQQPFNVGEASIWRHETKSGEIIHVSISGYPINHKGRPARITSARDVTALVLLQQQNVDLLEREHRARLDAERAARYFQSLFESIPGKFLVITPDNFEIVAVSDEYLAAILRSRAEIKGKCLFDVFPAAPHDAAAVGVRNLSKSLKRARLTGLADVMAVQSYPISRPDESGGGFEERYWSSVNTPIKGPDGEVVYIVHRVEDVTELILGGGYTDPHISDELTSDRRQVLELDVMLRSQELEAVRERAAELSGQLVTALESMSDAFFTLDSEWRFVYMNAQAEKVLFRKRTELLGKVIWDEFPAALNSQFEFEYRRATAEQTTVRFSEFYPPLGKWFEVNAYPSAGSLAVYFRDITETLQREEQLRQTQKMEVLGKLTGGIAHDFNNLLTVIIGNTERLALSLDKEPELQKLALVTSDAANRGAELVNRLMSFARQKTLKIEVLNVNKLISDMVPLLQKALAEDIEITFQPGAALWMVEVDRAQLESAILNIAINSRDAMPGGGCFDIVTMNLSLVSSLGLKNVEIPGGEYVVISMSDRGDGIAPEIMHRIFEPFFTTKDVGKGNGLGLSMVFGFLQQSDGFLDVSSQPGEGTTVTLYFPKATTEEISMGNSAPGEPEIEGGSEHILLVEDDDLVRDYVSDELSELGYRVGVACNGQEALEYISNNADIDLLLTDIIMPGGMNGRALAEAVTQIRPKMRILFTSGFTQGALGVEERLPAIAEFLPKPYSRAELASALRKLLDQTVR